jgi:hypothetical protein
VEIYTKITEKSLGITSCIQRLVGRQIIRRIHMAISDIGISSYRVFSAYIGFGVRYLVIHLIKIWTDIQRRDVLPYLQL